MDFSWVSPKEKKLAVSSDADRGRPDPVIMPNEKSWSLSDLSQYKKV